uniref:Secreted protein n=1 Tax=Micrurus lemniscatus lemniscatus TaxID=129467 RepID=A0A2D4JMK7_MICLE
MLSQMVCLLLLLLSEVDQDVGCCRLVSPVTPGGPLCEGKLLPTLHPRTSCGVPVAPPIGSSFPPVTRQPRAASLLALPESSENLGRMERDSFCQSGAVAAPGVP